jgi:hypothetical protein
MTVNTDPEVTNNEAAQEVGYAPSLNSVFLDLTQEDGRNDTFGEFGDLTNNNVNFSTNLNNIPGTCPSSFLFFFF